MPRRILVASSKLHGEHWPLPRLPDDWEITHASLRKHEADEHHPHWKDAVAQHDVLDGVIIYDHTKPGAHSVDGFHSDHLADLIHKRDAIEKWSQHVLKEESELLVREIADPVELSTNITELENTLRLKSKEFHEQLSEQIEEFEAHLLHNPSTSEGVELARHVRAHHPKAKLVAANLVGGKEQEYAPTAPDIIHHMDDVDKERKNPRPHEMLQRMLVMPDLPPHETKEGMAR